MGELRIAVVGIGATGSVLAAALLSKRPDTLLVVPRPGLRESLLTEGLFINGPLSYRVPVRQVVATIGNLKKMAPEVIFICTKTFNLTAVLDEIAEVFIPGMKIVSTHNGLGTEDVIADRFGGGAALRMTLNYGASITGPGRVETAFFNKPNHLGALTADNREVGETIADLLTSCGLDTQFVADIKLSVWKKMIMKCTMASICAVTNKTIKEALDFPPTREVAEVCFREALSVAQAMGYDLGPEYLSQAIGYLEKVGIHKDSMCQDIASGRPTEIDFLGGKVVEYGRLTGVPTPFYVVMTNMVKAIEDYSSR